RPLEHIRLKGEDVRKGALLLSPGERLNAGKLSLCAAAGIVTLKCGRQPMVGLLATGDELSETGKPLSSGQIYESNRLTLSVLASQAGAFVKVYPIVIDSLDATTGALNRAFDECDYVITSGGVSVGELDYIKPSFEAGGGILDFWRVSIKPGKPFVFGKRGTKLLFGLPGNPVSAFVTFLLMVRPALLRAQCARETGLRSVLGRTGERFVNRGDRRHFLRVKFGADHAIYSAGVQASHMLSSLSQAEALLDLQPNSTLEAGVPVSVLVWD
ncbi:MAG: molybdenum cofactor biosynthesis protein MoaA, partial [Verrucomicrobiales bacterium]|nr:molybdenum cofactor biosynthesis protein MoaA [Verrucomicrobiales bacterium]